MSRHRVFPLVDFGGGMGLFHAAGKVHRSTNNFIVGGNNYA